MCKKILPTLLETHLFPFTPEKLMSYTLIQWEEHKAYFLNVFKFPPLIPSKTIDQALLRCSEFLMSGTVPLVTCGALTAMSAITLL